MQIAELFEQVNTISDNVDYWFVRTDSGDNFESFINDKFIGIGWNEISLNDLLVLPSSEVKLKIARTNNLDLSTPKGRSNATGAYNKMLRFNELKKGDFVVIPSRSSSRLAFGIIKDSKIYTEYRENKLQECNYYKRRKVEWIDIKSIYSLDNIFYRIIQSRHAVSNIKKYQNYIDNVTDSLYEKDGYTHFVFDVNTEREINLDSLIVLMDSVKKLSKAINEEFNLDEQDDPLCIRLNVQSPGSVELKRRVGKTVVILSLMFASCRNGEIQKHGNHKIDTFIEVHTDTLKRIDKCIDELEIDRNKINRM